MNLNPDQGTTWQPSPAGHGQQSRDPHRQEVIAQLNAMRQTEQDRYARAGVPTMVMAVLGLALTLVGVLVTGGLGLVALLWIVPGLALARSKARALAWTTWLGPLGLLVVAVKR